MSTWVLAISCLCLAAGCGSDVLLGADDAGAVDGGDGGHGGHDADADGDQERLDCGQGMLCAQACREDLSCAAACEDEVCAPAAAAFVAFRDCGLENCLEHCGDFGSDACVNCVAAQCPVQALACLNASC